MKIAYGIFGGAALLAAATSYAQDPVGDDPAASPTDSAPTDTSVPADSAVPTDSAAPSDSADASSAAAAEPAPTEAASDTSVGAAPVTTESTEITSSSYIGIQGFWLDPDKDRGLATANVDHGGGLDLLYGWQAKNRLGYELHGWAETIETGKKLATDYYNYGLGLDLFYALGDRKHFTPFILVGGGGTYNDVYPDHSQKDGFDGFANGGVGFVTGPFTKAGQLRLRADVRYVYDFFGNKYGDIRYALGIEIPLFKEKVTQITVASQEPKVVAVPTGLTDSDGDGVIDEKDKCPDTAAGARVDGDGCPFDKVINLKGVTFEFDKTRLRPDAQTILDWATGILKKYPDMNVEVAGHTDSKGSDSYNEKLSEGRAQAVKQYFVEHGVPSSQLTVKGYGEKDPIADNTTDAGRELNRRVELRILN